MEIFALSFNSTFTLSPPQLSSFIKTNLSTQTLAVKPTRATAADGAAAAEKPQVEEKRKSTSLHEMIFKPLDNLISSSKANLPPFLDPERVVSGRFSTVSELAPTACAVMEGSLPPCLDGAYLQNGPNPHFTPRGPYHLADGDGMIHAVKIAGGKATYCSRFIRTKKYNTEQELGYPIYPNMFGAFTSRVTASMALAAARVLTGQFNPFADGVGTANTSIALIGGELHALIETDIPYQIKMTAEGDIHTVGRRDFESDEGFLMMTAHPKLDPDSGETFAFRYFVVPPFLKLFRIDASGKKHKSLPIYSLKAASYPHDFAVTKSFAIFPDTQVAMDPWEMVRGRALMKVDLGKVPKLGIVPRYAEDEEEMIWIDTPGLNLLHTANSWDEDDAGEIVIVATNTVTVEHLLERFDLVDLVFEKIVIDVRRKVVRRYPVSDRKVDFPVINPKYAGKKNRYVYAAMVENMPKMVGIVKIDLSLSAEDGVDCTVASRVYGEDCYGSEPMFVAATEADGAEEDDGYLVMYLNNERTQESHFVVMDAKSPTLEIVAAVKLPRKVPQGFHSIFVKQSVLQQV